VKRALLLAVLLVMAACGSDDEPDTAPEGDVRVQLAFDEPLRAGPVVWRVTVVNDGSDELRMTFPSSQRADVTLTRDGELAYQWSADMLFTQVIGHESLRPGTEKTFVLDESDLDVPPGEYELRAVITSSDHMDLAVSRHVTVGDG